MFAAQGTASARKSLAIYSEIRFEEYLHSWRATNRSLHICLNRRRIDDLGQVLR